MIPDKKRRPAGNGTAAQQTRWTAASLTPLPGHEPSAWLAGRLTTILHADVLPWCGHRSDVLTVGLWSDPVLSCPACVAGLPPLTGDDNYRCDRCGIVDRGTRGLVVATVLPGFAFCNPRAVHPFLPAPPIRLFVAFGLCPACLVRELGEVPA